MTASSPPSVAVLGAGIAGLSVAWNLSRAGISVRIFEASARPGGVIHSDRDGAYLIEHGPNSIQPNEAVWSLISDAGLTDRVCEANPLQRNRFVVRDAKPVPIPLSPAGMLRSPLFSAHGKLRLLGEPFIRRGDGTESVAEFVRRRVGREFLDYAIDPFVAGVYAGDPEHLSMQHAFPRMVALEERHGSLIRGMFARRKAGKAVATPVPRRSLISFLGGMEDLPARLASILSEQLRLKQSVTKIARDADGFRVETSSVDESDGEGFDAVVSCVPVHQLNAILPTGVDRIPLVVYPPVTVVGLGYLRAQVAHALDGFGLLVPSVEREFEILGALFSSTLFPGRAPDGSVLLTAFLGGMRHRDAGYLNGEEAVAVAHRDLTRLLGINGKPQFRKVIAWEKAIPQYDLHYARTLEVLSRLEERLPGLFFAGNYRGGISVVDTVSNAGPVADRVRHFLEEGRT